MQGLGLFIGLHGYGFYLVSTDLHRYRHFTLIGLIGKSCGAVGWLYSAMCRRYSPCRILDEFLQRYHPDIVPSSQFSMTAEADRRYIEVILVVFPINFYLPVISAPSIALSPLKGTPL
jgi:hypothetical protein